DPLSRQFHFYHATQRRPPDGTLFPYTTLFRSSAGGPRGDRPSPAPARSAGPCRRGRRGGAFGQGPGSPPPAAPPAPASPHNRNRDRKSTRLNSSHVKKSYTVFCWKKKLCVKWACKWRACLVLVKMMCCYDA